MNTLDQERKDGSRRIFSISNEFSDVNDILNSIPKSARSRYICEAIREKYERESNPHSIENQVRAMLTHIVHAEQYANQIFANKGIQPANMNQEKPFSFLYQILSGIPMFGTTTNYPLQQTQTATHEEKSTPQEVISTTKLPDESLTGQQVSPNQVSASTENDHIIHNESGINEIYLESHAPNADALPQQPNLKSNHRGNLTKRKLIETSLGT